MDVGEDMSEYPGQDGGTLRVTIREAANRLGVTEAAIRKRIQRGSLNKEHGEDGRVYVYLDLSQDMSHPESQVHREAQVHFGELIEELRDRVSSLERMLEEERQARTEERRRHDTLMAQLMQRIPELEAPSEPPGGPQSAAERSSREDPRPGGRGAQERPQERRGFWSRLFGG
jgi:hypothetical protein